MLLRVEEIRDRRAVEELVRDAFWNVYEPGAHEHWLLHELRKTEDFVPSLSVVAIDQMHRIVGYVAYSKAKLKLDGGSEKTLLCLGPIAVTPDWQKRGVGSQLIETTIQMACQEGWGAITLMGDPRYYRRFGFRVAERWDIRASNDMWATGHLMLELISGFLEAGKIQESAVFEAKDDKMFEEFDRTFPVKDKAHQPSQEEFAWMMSLMYPVNDAGNYRPSEMASMKSQ